MSWWNFLKGILPDSLIKIINNNRILVIRDNKIFSNNEIVGTEQDTKEILTAIKSFNSKGDTLPFQILHKDLSEEYVDYELISINQKESLSKLKEVLPLEDVECILMARRVHIAFSKKDKSLIENLLNQLNKHYPKRGRKVLNLITAGYFDELIIPMIDICKEKEKDNYKREFRDFYDSILEFFPTAIFVGNLTTKDHLKKEINKRLRMKTIPFIRIHAIGSSNIDKVENVTEKLQEEFKGKFNITDERFVSPSGLKAQRLIIKIIKQ